MEYGHFHDSCITNLTYKSGAYVDKHKTMHFGDIDGRELNLIIQRQWEPITLELCFVGVRRFHVVGWQDNYLCDIMYAYLSFHKDVLPGEPIELIVWADTEYFNLEEIAISNSLKEPADSYVIANTLKWRVIE